MNLKLAAFRRRAVGTSNHRGITSFEKPPSEFSPFFGGGIIILINVIVGIWLSSIWIWAFYQLYKGYALVETNRTVLLFELYLSIAVLLFFLLQIPFWIRRLRC